MFGAIMHQCAKFRHFNQPNSFGNIAIFHFLRSMQGIGKWGGAIAIHWQTMRSGELRTLSQLGPWQSPG